MSKEPALLPAKGRFRHFPRTLRECVQPSAKAGFAHHGFADARLLSDWPMIAGPELAARCIPLRIRHGRDSSTLTLQVSPGFAPIVQHQEPVLLERIAQFFGFRAISKITLVQAPLPQAPAPLPVRGKPMPSEALPILSTVRDGAVQSALASLAAAMASRKG